MYYYHRGPNPLDRCYREWAGLYMVRHMCEGAWFYLMDDFGNCVEYAGHYK